MQNGKESGHKLAPVVNGPYPGLKVDAGDNNLVIKRSYHIVENISRNRVTLAPKVKINGVILDTNSLLFNFRTEFMILDDIVWIRTPTGNFAIMFRIIAIMSDIFVI